MFDRLRLPRQPARLTRWILSLGLLVVALSRCQETPGAAPPSQQARLTAEEAGYLGEVEELSKASCRVGTTYRVLVGHRQVIGGVWSYPRPRYTRRVPVYENKIADQLQLPHEQPRKDWVATGRQLSELLPPESLQDFHSDLQAVIAAQTAVAASNGQGDSVTALRQSAASVCATHNQFMTSIVAREPIAAEIPATEVVSLSYTPVFAPVTLSVNSKAKFSVSVGKSVATPIGNIGFSVSPSSSEAKYPKRLVIRTAGQRRVFLLERPFQVVVPAGYGVVVSNDTDSIVLDVEAPHDRTG